MSKFLRNTILTLLAFTFLSSCKVGRFVYFNTATIKDYKKFPYNEFEANSQPFQFMQGTPKIPQTVTLNDQKWDLEDFLIKHKTVAFLVIQNDSILMEKYYRGYAEDDWVTSFSMAKSVISMLIGKAIEDGLIHSVHDPVSKYLPEMKQNGFDKVSILHVLQMTSGLKFNEGYFNPFGEVATFYYGRHLRKSTLKLKLKEEPGTQFEYMSGNTQILGVLLDRVLAEKGETVSSYFEQNIWKQIGMEFNGSWNVDKKKNPMEKTFCCLNATARDFAKLGRLYLNNGKWNGKQVIAEEWVKASTSPDLSAGGAKHYQYQWWIPEEQNGYFTEGILGQLIYVVPEKDLIMVRLGKSTAKQEWKDIMTSIAEHY